MKSTTEPFKSATYSEYGSQGPFSCFSAPAHLIQIINLPPQCHQAVLRLRDSGPRGSEWLMLLFSHLQTIFYITVFHNQTINDRNDGGVGGKTQCKKIQRQAGHESKTMFFLFFIRKVLSQNSILFLAILISFECGNEEVHLRSVFQTYIYLVPWTRRFGCSFNSNSTLFLVFLQLPDELLLNSLYHSDSGGPD